MGQANHVKANETLMKTDVFSMNSFKVWGFFKLYSERGGAGGRILSSVVVKTIDTAISR